MLPRVILYNGVSVDGRLDGFTGDIGLYYELAGHWNADAILSGSETILAGYPSPEEPPEPPEPNLDDPRQLLVIVDSRGRIRNWNQIRSEPYWRDAIALCSCSTPQTYLDELHKKRVEHIVAGDDHVDLRAALQELNARYGVKIVRVDSGGKLNGVLLRAGLVDKVSVLISPSLAGGATPRSIFVALDLTSPEGVIRLKLAHVEQVRDDAVWLRYELVRPEAL